MAAAAEGVRHLVLTGVPGVGKTTIVRKICEALQGRNIPSQGFFTEEIRHGGKRTGFDIVTLDGIRGPLARVGDRHSNVPSTKPEFRVGQYVVDRPSLEQITLPVLRKKLSIKSVIVIDEIGKMELCSRYFSEAVKGVFADPKAVVIATIPVPKGKPLPLVEEIRRRKDVLLVTVTRENRDSILDDVINQVIASYGS